MMLALILLLLVLAKFSLALLLAIAVNYAPMVDFGFKILDSVVFTVVPVVVAWFIRRWFKLDEHSKLGQKIIAVASNAAALGLSRVNAAVDAKLPADVKSAAIAEGVAYFNNAISQKTLDTAKITAPIDAMIEAQMQKLLLQPAAPAAVVVTPVVPAPEEPKP